MATSKGWIVLDTKPWRILADFSVRIYSVQPVQVLCDIPSDNRRSHRSHRGNRHRHCRENRRLRSRHVWSRRTILQVWCIWKGRWLTVRVYGLVNIQHRFPVRTFAHPRSRWGVLWNRRQGFLRDLRRWRRYGRKLHRHHDRIGRHHHHAGRGRHHGHGKGHRVVSVIHPDISPSASFSVFFRSLVSSDQSRPVRATFTCFESIRADTRIVDFLPWYAGRLVRSCTGNFLQVGPRARPA